MKSDLENKRLKQFFVKLKQEDGNKTPPFDNFLLDSIQNKVTRNAPFFNRRFALAAMLVFTIISSLYIMSDDKSTEEKALSQWQSPTNSLLQSNSVWHWRPIEHPGVVISNWTSPTKSLAKLRKIGKYNRVPGLEKSKKNSNRNL